MHASAAGRLSEVGAAAPGEGVALGQVDPPSHVHQAQHGVMEVVVRERGVAVGAQPGCRQLAARLWPNHDRDKLLHLRCHPVEP